MIFILHYIELVAITCFSFKLTLNQILQCKQQDLSKALSDVTQL